MTAVPHQAAAGAAGESKFGLFVCMVSSGLSAVERVLLMGLAASIFLLILVNIATRYAGSPIFWIDEAATYAMVIMCFVGISLTLRQRLDFAVTFVEERLGPGGRRVLKAALSAVAFAYACFLLYAAWRMFDPLRLIAVDFDVAAFVTKTGNFLYSEPTPTLGIPKYLIYLVLPWFAVTSFVHALANLVEDLGLVEPASAPAQDAAAPLDGG